jgi:hypothetical protein
MNDHLLTIVRDQVLKNILAEMILNLKTEKKIFNLKMIFTMKTRIFSN